MLDTVPAGAVGRPVSLDTGRVRALSIAGGDAVLARVDATLGGGSLTTLVVHAGADDAVVVSPLRTQATTDDTGVARGARGLRDRTGAGGRARRRVLARAGRRRGRAPPRRDSPPVRTTRSRAATSTSAPATYALVRDGDEGVPLLSFVGGEVYTLLLSEGADGRGTAPDADRRRPARETSDRPTDPGRRAARRRPPAGAAVGVAPAAFGGCDGGLFGTGSENADADAGPAIATDPRSDRTDRYRRR